MDQEGGGGSRKVWMGSGFAVLGAKIDGVGCEREKEGRGKRNMEGVRYCMAGQYQ